MRLRSRSYGGITEQHGALPLEKASVTQPDWGVWAVHILKHAAKFGTKLPNHCIVFTERAPQKILSAYAYSVLAYT